MNFEKDVIARSQEIPVMVDFWAPWCGPCRYIGPVLEKLAVEQEGRWELVKVNVDENQQIAANYSVRGIPAIKLFHKGEVIGEFSGALPRNAVEKWLDDHIPDASGNELDLILEQEQDLPDKNLIEVLTNFVLQHPENKVARVHLARHLVFIDPGSALQHIEDIDPSHDQYDLSDRIIQFSLFLQESFQEDLPVAIKMKEAQEKMKNLDFEPGIQLIIEANREDKTFRGDMPRLTAIAFFEIIGRDHPLSKKYRRKFDMVLY